MRSDKDDGDQSYRLQITAISNKRPGPPPSLAGETWAPMPGFIPADPPSSNAKYIEFAWNDVRNNMTATPLTSAGAIDSTTACGLEVAGCDSTRNNRWHYIYQSDAFSLSGSIDNADVNPSLDLPAGRIGLILPIIPNSFTSLYLAAVDKLGNMGPYQKVIKVGNDQIPPAMTITAVDMESGLTVSGGTPWLPSDNVRIQVKCTDASAVTDLTYTVRQGGAVTQMATTITTGTPGSPVIFELGPSSWTVGGGGTYTNDTDHPAESEFPPLVTDFQYEFEFYAHDASGTRPAPSTTPSASTRVPPRRA